MTPKSRKGRGAAPTAPAQKPHSLAPTNLVRPAGHPVLRRKEQGWEAVLSGSNLTAVASGPTPNDALRGVWRKWDQLVAQRRSA